MKTMIKKVIFVSLLDVISIPSGNEHSVDITDFQLKHDFFRALQADNNIVRVNILGYDKNQVMYSNDITFKKYNTDSEVRDVFYHQLQEMTTDFKDMAKNNSGIFINEWKNLAVIKSGLRGGTCHTAVRMPNFYMKNHTGVTMAQWLSDAVNGDIYDSGMDRLEE